MRIEDLKVGMQIRVGKTLSAHGYYSDIVDAQVTITHLGEHPADDEHDGPKFPKVYVYVKHNSGSYKDRPPKGLEHLADQHGILRSWFIYLPDAILLENEECIKALPIW